MFQVSHTLETHNGEIISVNISPDQKSIVTTGVGTVKVWSNTKERCTLYDGGGNSVLFRLQ